MNKNPLLVFGTPTTLAICGLLASSVATAQGFGGGRKGPADFGFDTPTPAPAEPRFIEEPDTEDLVADSLRQEATNFLNQENLRLTADIELNFDARSLDGGDTFEDEDSNFDGDGRVRLTMEGEHTAGGRFIKGRADALFKEDGDASVDDAWLAIGNATTDVQLGRFEAINLFPLGLDTVLVNAGDGSARVYQANLARGRIGGSGAQIALRHRFSDAMRVEVATIWGDPDDDGINADSITGVRPVATFGSGPYSVSLGGEWLEYDLDGGGESERSGLGASFRYNDGPILAHFNAAYLDDEDSDEEVTTFGANMIYDGRIGLGVVHSITEADSQSDDPTVTSVYGAYVIPIFGFDRAKMTLAASYSVADDVSENVADEIFAARVRFNYAF